MTRRRLKTKSHVLTACAAAAFMLTVNVVDAFAKTTLQITFRKKTKEDKVEAECVAETYPSSQKVMQKDELEWKLKNPGPNKCADFDPEQVVLVFASDKVVGETDSSGKDKIKGKDGCWLFCGGGDRAEAFVLQNAAETKHKYEVWYKGSRAEDPELDVSGTILTHK